MQLHNEVVKLTTYNQDIDARLFVGGTNRDAEIKRLEKSQPQIVVGTIGKIKDLAVSTNVLKIHTAKAVVIDEADMVLEVSELAEIDSVFAKWEKDIQILTFSATIPQELVKFINKYLDKCELCDTTKKQISKKSIEHIFIPTKNKNKNELLLKLLLTFHPYLAIIFANTKTKVDEIAQFLGEQGLKLVKLTGDLEARERKQVLKRLKDGKIQYVVASDIASRGIDIQGVSHIINYELPNDIEFYIHRSGRSARYQLEGQCISFYDYEDDKYLDKLEEKGLHCVYKALVNDELVPTKERNYRPKTSTFVAKIESELHKKIPVPKKVKPGYKKKRKEAINKELRKMKRERIDALYRKLNNKK
jgi:ATP-dependent RNA helicase CshB